VGPLAGGSVSTKKPGSGKGPHVFTYSAICDVPEETVVRVTAWLLAHRREIGTRVGRRVGTVRDQAELVLRWFRDDAPLRQLAAEAATGFPLRTGICTRALTCSPSRPPSCTKCWHAAATKAGRT